MELKFRRSTDGFPAGLSGTWVDGAKWVFGLPDKQYSRGLTPVGFGCHSMVGTLEGSYGRLFSLEKEDGRYSDYAAVSWHFSNPKEGPLIQHYPLEAATWCHGSRDANLAYLSMEMEGGYDPYDEVLTASQLNNCIELWTLLERANFLGRPLTMNGTLLEHHQLVEIYGGSPTSCASGRYNYVWNLWADGKRIPETVEDDMDDELRKAMLARERIRWLASNPNIDVVYEGLAVLEKAGIIPKV